MDRRLHEIEDGLGRELGAFLGSVNFSGYSDRERLRSDDLAVRSVASQEVLVAKNAVSEAISAWWRDAAGEPTREQPFPKPEVNHKLRELRAFEQSLADLESAIRSAPAPDIDAVWNRRSDGAQVLNELLALDKALLESSRRLADSAHGISASTLADVEPFASLRAPLSDLQSVSEQRKRLIANAR
ncbi:MAG: hypothetical protein KGN02_08130 [bacterium]|nr:hypothetical protein [bacterium]